MKLHYSTVNKAFVHGGPGMMIVFFCLALKVSSVEIFLMIISEYGFCLVNDVISSFFWIYWLDFQNRAPCFCCYHRTSLTIRMLCIILQVFHRSSSLTDSSINNSSIALSNIHFHRKGWLELKYSRNL